MVDVHDNLTRSYNMSRIRSTNTKPEILVRKFLFAKGFRYKLHDRTLPGKPDIVLPKYKTVIFVNGCFWHGHRNCKYFVLPKTRTQWWFNKITRNKELDLRNIKELKSKGWKVFTIFECSLRKKLADNILMRLQKRIEIIGRN